MSAISGMMIWPRVIRPNPNPEEVMSATPVKFWIDNAWEKHECFPYDRSVGSRVVRHDGREITLLLPE